MRSPRIALTVGDPAGIGPEIVAACLRDTGERRLVVLGPEELRPADVPLLEAVTTRDSQAPYRALELERAVRGLADPGASDAPLLWLATPTAGPWTVGRAQASAGHAALAALRTGAELARRGVVDALVTAPVSKEALRAAGARAEGQTQLLAAWAGRDDVDMLAVAGALRVSLLTRHTPLREALASIREPDVVAALLRLARGLEGLGLERPRLALAGLNPHAGEGGLLGSEEQDLLIPAAERARTEHGLDVTGPLPPDTVFLQGLQGRFDAVLALYHDQGFIPVKLAAPMGAVTVLLGLPYLRVSPAHGTAFDIAGRGVADPANLRVALEQASAWARRGPRRAGAVSRPSSRARPGSPRGSA